MADARRRARQGAIALLVSGGLLALVFSQMDTDAALARLREADWRLIGLSFVLSFAVLIVRGLRFRFLTSQSPFSSVIAAIAGQNFLNRVAPFRLGELSLPYLLHRTTGEPPATSLIMLVLVRLIELWALFVTAIGAVLGWFGGAEAERVVLLAAIAAALGLTLLTFRRWLGLGLRLADALARRTGLAERGAVRNALDRVHEAATGDARLTLRQHAALLLGTVAIMALQFALYGCLLRSLGFALHPLQIIVGVTAAQVAGALPVLSVGSVGTHETGWAAGFVWVGLALPDAVMTGVYTQVVTLAFAVVFAGPAALWWVRRRRDG
ncbi:MAG: flippase-like domain-containing protein [Myxococcales bacterium]|nr:flippase-like domain-containing protein [Myxococcales bacterium]